MKAQIQLDAEDILLQLKEFVCLYATVLTPEECKALALAMHTLLYKTK